MDKKVLGSVVGGSFSDGILCRLGNEAVTPSIGSFCCVLAGSDRVFCLVADVSVEMTGSDLLQQLDPGSSFWPIFQRNNSIRTVRLVPQLLLGEKGRVNNFVQMTSPLSLVVGASDQDFLQIFGKEEFDCESPKLSLGYPDGTSVDVCLDLKKFVERSNGIFGKTGTGKTFVTRMMLAGLVRSNICVNLIFDMHGEYGLSARSEGGTGFVQGLKSLFPQKTALFSLDPQATRQRGCSPDIEVSFDLSEITVDDVIALQSELNLHSTAVEAANLLFVTFGKNWLYKLLSPDTILKDLASEVGAHAESISALYRKVKRIESLPFIQRTQTRKKGNVVDLLIEYLDKGINVILEFGRQTSSLTYLLVSGILTRQIHRAYIKKTENYLATQKSEDMPIPLVITIEEAHKFLSPILARQTIFGMIAREMRKYFVTLFVVDQRPSGLCSEIVSQLGTKICGKLEDDRDLASIIGGGQLRNLLATLESKGHVFVTGHAIAIPIAVRTRRYDEAFYKTIQGKSCYSKKSLKDSVDEIFF